MHYLTGTKHEGSWLDDKKHGEGVRIYYNGDTFTATYENDLIECASGVFKQKRGLYSFVAEFANNIIQNKVQIFKRDKDTG